MKKIIFGIFAHPDDEAFGPSGTLLRETRDGNDVHLVTLTLGEGGMNPDNHADLAKVREQEWLKAGELIGAKSMQFLGYSDGHLCNVDMIEAGKKIRDHVKKTLEDAPDDAEVEFMTLDLNGLTGHIDHIVAARAASWAFYTLKKDDARFSRIRYACLPAEHIPASNTDWLYMDAGHETSEIDETVDNRDARDEIVAIMRCHDTQRSDCEANLARQGDSLGLDYFIVKN